MKIQFDANLDFQKQAIDSVAGIFAGQEICQTNLTRRTIVKIINDSGRLESFKNNPQKFIEQVSTIIQHQMRLFVVDGIKYHKIGDDHFYAQELFGDNELFGYLQKKHG